MVTKCQWLCRGFTLTFCDSQDEGPSVSTHRLALTMLIKIVKSLGCAYGCGEGHRGLSGDRLRHQVFRENVRKLKLIKMSPLYFWHQLLRLLSAPSVAFSVPAVDVLLFVWAHRLCCSPAVADFQMLTSRPWGLLRAHLRPRVLLSTPVDRLSEKAQKTLEQSPMCAALSHFLHWWYANTVCCLQEVLLFWVAYLNWEAQDIVTSIFPNGNYD